MISIIKAIINKFKMTPDAPDVWDSSIPPGGFVCSSCGMPTESEPCETHQRHAWLAMW